MVGQVLAEIGLDYGAMVRTISIINAFTNLACSPRPLRFPLFGCHNCSLSPNRTNRIQTLTADAGTSYLFVHFPLKMSDAPSHGVGVSSQTAAKAKGQTEEEKLLAELQKL